MAEHSNQTCRTDPGQHSGTLQGSRIGSDVDTELTRLHPQGKGGPKGYCVETSQISLADATLSDVRSHDELRPESDWNGQVGHPDCLL